MELISAVEADGFGIQPAVFDADRVRQLVARLEQARATIGLSVVESRGHIYGIRNLDERWPEALAVASETSLAESIGTILGKGFGLVRAIFFDKPPGRTWSLPWHRDRTIAIAQAAGLPEGFMRPTRKAGVPHVEAPVAVLQRMLTARVALDDVTDENGPLLVVPGSHQDDVGAALPPAAELARRARPIYLRAGDVLLIRPLVLHRSGASQARTSRHRRTLHFELAAEDALPCGVEWHRFVPLARRM